MVWVRLRAAIGSSVGVCGWELGSPSCLYGFGLFLCVVSKSVCCVWGARSPKLFLLVGFGSVLGV